jgi:hypothetical protein
LAAGKAKQQIAQQLGITRQTVRRWEQRYLQQGTEKGLQDAPRSGRPRLIGPEKIQWLGDHPRFHVHYTPTSASWLNPVERLFGEVSQKCLQRRSAAPIRRNRGGLGTRHCPVFGPAQ